jgi:hypothetical protein
MGMLKEKGKRQKAKGKNSFFFFFTQEPADNLFERKLV